MPWTCHKAENLERERINYCFGEFELILIDRITFTSVAFHYSRLEAGHSEDVTKLFLPAPKYTPKMSPVVEENVKVMK